MTTLFVENITVMDFSYLHPDRGLLGESWIVDVELSGDLDNEGVIFDFAYAKKEIKQTIDLEFDHKLVIPKRNSGLKLFSSEESSSIEFQYGENYTLHYNCPSSALCLIESEIVDHKSTITFLKEKLAQVLPSNITNIDIHLKTEKIDGAFYHYSHGLKKHYGNCQRMAHGHRSRIKIYKNGDRNDQLECDWATLWRDIYIGTEEDLTSTEIINNISYCQFNYISTDGSFSLRLPKKHCYMIETESTVEFIAHHIAKQLKQKHPENTYKVKAYEGVKKGAIAIR